MFCPSFPHKTTDWLGRPRQETKLWWARLEGVGESLVRESPPPPSYPAVWWRVMTSLWNDSNKSNESKMEILSLVALLIFFLVLLFITWHFISCFCLRGRVGACGDDWGFGAEDWATGEHRSVFALGGQTHCPALSLPKAPAHTLPFSLCLLILWFNCFWRNLNSGHRLIN